VIFRSTEGLHFCSANDTGHRSPVIEARVGLFGPILALGTQFCGALLHHGTFCGAEAVGLGLEIVRGHCHATAAAL
jgi:hypothetical protein